MLHHFTIETDREVDSDELAQELAHVWYEWAPAGVEWCSVHVDRDAAAAERAIAKRDRAIRLLLDNIAEQAGWFVKDVIDDLSEATSGFPADVVDTIRHVCGIDAPVEVES